MRVRKKLGNRGSALVTVMVAVTFMSILVTTLLYVSATNYKTKHIDYLNKVSFYECETALEEIKALFVIDASKACNEAYQQTLLHYATKSAAEREEYFKYVFVDKLKLLWGDRKNDVSELDYETLHDHFDLSSASVACLIDSGAVAWDYSYANGTAVLKNINVGVTVNNHTTTISTSIYIEAPGINLAEDDYADWTPGMNSDRRKIDIGDYVVYKDWHKY